MNFKERLHKIKAFVFDIDGVLTDGRITIHSDNTTSRNMFARDGSAMTRALKAGYKIAIISYARDENLRTRYTELGLTEVYLKIIDKEEKLKEFESVYFLEPEEILFMGDDLPDYNAMKRCGVPCCPHDAAHEIREISVYVSPYNGGHGCVRDVIEQAMRLHGKW
ncbi:MAG TPA: HAD hydrolase family protein [Bacteroidia bacterium]|jgi:3-deoxy-D-manno-octulosonate 8-phosphate phosphatase (KDO 8-P phosphatase)|nr:HAD hydrolase family protein [Bacteroidia bacterium]